LEAGRFAQANVEHVHWPPPFHLRAQSIGETVHPSLKRRGSGANPDGPTISTEAESRAGGRPPRNRHDRFTTVGEHALRLPPLSSSRGVKQHERLIPVRLRIWGEVQVRMPSAAARIPSGATDCMAGRISFSFLVVASSTC